MLSLARSRYTLITQLLFLVTNAVGVVLITIYNAETPDLYPNNAHHTIGWVITVVVSAQVGISLVGKLAGAVSSHRKPSSSSEQHSFLPVSQSSYYSDPYRHSEDTLQGQHDSSESSRDNSISTLNDQDALHREISYKESFEDERDHQDDQFEELPLSSPSTAPRGKWTLNAIKLVTSRAWKYIDIVYKVIDRIILPFGFVALTTGVITFGRFFVSQP